MITHKISFLHNKFNMRWHIDLPFRLHKGDIVNISLLNKGDLIYGSLTDEWIDFCSRSPRFEIKYIEIAADMSIFVILCN